MAAAGRSQETYLIQSFEALGLAAGLTRAVAEQGYTQPTPVQAQAIPAILAGRDVLAGAQTGTGKTAAFTLPLLQRLTTPGPRPRTGRRIPVRALILTPTRELAAQIEESVRVYGRHLTLETALIYGGVGMRQQIDALARGADILVATPGRLLDHARQKTVDLADVEVLVLDEADRMLDMGFIHDIRRILALLPARRQNLLFSATYSEEIRGLASGLLDEPELIEVARRNAESELVVQRVYAVAQAHKRALLVHLVTGGDWRQVLVFTRTKHGANRLAEQLMRSGIQAAAIHGNKSQPARTRALAAFKAGAVRVLVATDIAARGLDIEELPHVVNFDLPHVPEDYVHRIGRTGRAGSAGEALSLVAREEEPQLRAIEKLLARRLERLTAPVFEPETPQPVQPVRPPHAAQRKPASHDTRDVRSSRRNRPAQNPGRGRHRDLQIGARDPEAQPRSNAGQLFPSSGSVFGEPRRQNAFEPAAGRRDGHRGRPAREAALLGGGRRSG
jgi:ATP-dependent RNA helicase RhlE